MPDKKSPEKDQDTKAAPKKSGLTKSDLKALISETVTTAVKAEVETALAPVKEQQTDWMKHINFATHNQDVSDPKTKGHGVARLVRAIAFGKGDTDRAQYFAKNAWDDKLGKSIEKILQVGDFTSGGFLVPPEFSAELIEFLRARTVVRAAGARTLPMNAGSLTIRRHDGTATASYIGESSEISVTEPAGGQIIMTAKKLAAVVPISNDLLTFSAGPSADEWVRDDLVESISVREDVAFIRDDGLQNRPKGMRFWAGNVGGTNGTSSVQIEEDFKDAINFLELANVHMIRPAWFMSPRSKNHLINLRDGTSGELVYPEIRNAKPTVFGWPVFVTTSIPVNLGGGTNETELYLADMSDVIIAESSSLEIAVDSSASYLENGTLVSAFTRDETLIRAISRHDFAVRHDASIAVINAITWGA